AALRPRAEAVPEREEAPKRGHARLVLRGTFSLGRAALRGPLLGEPHVGALRPEAAPHLVCTPGVPRAIAPGVAPVLGAEGRRDPAQVRLQRGEARVAQPALG